MKKIALLSLIILASFITSTAQDIIHRKNNEQINCKIKEIGLDEVKYVLPNYPQDVLFSIDTEKISKVVFENGEELTFQKEMTNSQNYLDNRKDIIKLEFLSPLTGNTTLAWEHSLKPGKSIEATLGLVGLGLDPYDENQAGAFIKFGYKFIKDPDFYLRGMKYAHILKGSYVKPEISLGLVYHDITNSNSYIDNLGYWHYDEFSERANSFAGALQIVLGKQWVFDNIFSFDLHGGIGYGFLVSSRKETHTYFDDEAYHYGFLVTPGDVPISFSGGLKIGLLIK